MNDVLDPPTEAPPDSPDTTQPPVETPAEPPTDTPAEETAPQGDGDGTPLAQTLDAGQTTADNHGDVLGL